MNRPALRVVCLALVLPLGGWFLASAMAPARAQDPKPAPAPDDKGGERPRGEGRRNRGGGFPNLRDSMEQLERDMKVVFEGIEDPAKRDAVLESLGRSIAAAGSSQSGDPKNLAEIPAEKQAEHKLAFRRTLTVLARDIAEIELLVIDGKTADARAKLEKLGPQAEAAHEKFGGEEH